MSSLYWRDIFAFANGHAEFPPVSASRQIRPPIYSFRQRSQRRKIVAKCEWLCRAPNAASMLMFDRILDTIVYALVQGVLIALIVLPLIFRHVLDLTPTSVPFSGAL